MLNLSDRIKEDIQGNVNTLTYLVVINNNFENIYISTQKHLFDGNVWEDIDFKLQGIKESIDLVNRKFKINNVNFSLSNMEVSGARFSDMVTNFELINKQVDIYYKTISCRDISDCALLYRGSIRSIKHDSKKCTVFLEDSTEDKLSKEVPMANIGYKRTAYSKEYYGRPIPITYGKVEKAPSIPTFVGTLDENDSYSQNTVRIISDDTRGDREINLDGFFQDEETAHLEVDVNPLYIYKGDYFQVLEDWSYKCTTETGLWEDVQQYRVMPDELLIDKKYHKAEAVNPPANNELCCIKKRRPNK